MAIVSIKTQQVTFYDADGWIMRAPVSTGTTGRETPAGVFAILEKNKDHRSNMYDDADMPNMQRITWNGIALHGGPLPGYAASHGCVRMPFGFAEKLFDRTRIGMRVIVSPIDAEPVEFSHRGALRAERGGHRGCAGACRDARPRGRRGRQDGRRGEESRRDSGARDSIAHGVAAQAGRAQDPRRRRARLRRQGARRRKDGRGQGAGRGPQAKGRRQGRGTGERSSTPPRLDAKSKLDAAAGAKDAAKAAGTRKADTAKAASDAKLALEPVRSTSAAQRRSFMCGARRISRTGWRRRCSMPPLRFRSRSAIPKADRHACVHCGGAQRGGPALDRGHDRQRRQRQERARPNHHPAGSARSHRADCIAAILDRCLGRAA